jgi:hypothetical protein
VYAENERLTAIVAISAVETFSESIITGALLNDALFESFNVVGDIACGNQRGDGCK